MSAEIYLKNTRNFERLTKFSKYDLNVSKKSSIMLVLFEVKVCAVCALRLNMVTRLIYLGRIILEKYLRVYINNNKRKSMINSYMMINLYLC